MAVGKFPIFNSEYIFKRSIFAILVNQRVAIWRCAGLDSNEELEVTLADVQHSAKTIWEKMKKTDPRKLLILKSVSWVKIRFLSFQTIFPAFSFPRGFFWTNHRLPGGFQTATYGQHLVFNDSTGGDGGGWFRGWPQKFRCFFYSGIFWCCFFYKQKIVYIKRSWLTVVQYTFFVTPFCFWNIQ